MSPESREIIGLFAAFIVGGWIGFLLQRHESAQEVREWQAIARRAQHLNRIADALREQRHGSHQHAHFTDRDD